MFIVYFIVLPAVALIGAWLSFAPERAFHRRVAARTPLSVNGFYETFYARSGVPQEVVQTLFPIYSKFFDLDGSRLHPRDRPPIMNDLDTAPLVRQIERAFGIEISDRAAEALDGSFDSIARYLANRHTRDSDPSAAPPEPARRDI